MITVVKRTSPMICKKTTPITQIENYEIKSTEKNRHVHLAPSPTANIRPSKACRRRRLTNNVCISKMNSNMPHGHNKHEASTTKLAKGITH